MGHKLWPFERLQGQRHRRYHIGPFIYLPGNECKFQHQHRC